ncbi:MAG: B12-binding domain-containing protein, partial [Flavisolibacter sp.]|nr:B12-binding domain-containing protein [Flavisolibacter sp.]
LRIWEVRYKMLRPKRKDSLHRVYDNEDLKHMLRVSFLYHNGWKISKIASLDPANVEEEVRKVTMVTDVPSTFINQLLEAAVDFDEYKFTKILNSIIASIGFEKTMTEVCYPYLTKLGHLWSTNNVIPAQEHFSSYMVQNRVISETEQLAVKGKKPEIILLCPQGEYHELPLLFINYLLKKNGWGTLYLGASVSLKELSEVVAIPGIRYIYIHLITNFTGFELQELMERICTSYRDKEIIASGNGFRLLQRSFTNLTVLLNDAAIYSFVRRDHLGST